ncbi:MULTISPECIES: DUF2850 domain-containing protein [unclassified Photobacterium]|uniref:DUF2850 domain-containing protein n=1 Tax=unclassified Photobacterium TaxID=2628852 RepID=UPI001EDFDD7F|nr:MULTISPECIES: DUF2850 domain-containing protein [unclassified Photobacterium]MCG3865752.1 DUF2850 domain-containing protein [Photobacterium sp. Ph6]MCG3877798.1 DUF2850 domain-containing protein [Photobacterium sp. Ph5]
MDKVQSSKVSTSHLMTKRSQTIILILLLVGGLVLTSLFVSKKSLSSWLKPPSPVGIYGYWKEHDVARYAAESFEIRPLGIYRDGRLVTTQYSWDGQTLSYQLGELHYSYLYLNNTFIRHQPAHYISTFVRTSLLLN